MCVRLDDVVEALRLKAILKKAQAGGIRDENILVLHVFRRSEQLVSLQD
jgi:hypothetical protein